MKIEVSDEVALGLQRVAQRRGFTVSELLETLLVELDGEQPFATLADMANDAEKTGLAAPQPVNTAERSREILQTEYADHLKRRRMQ